VYTTEPKLCRARSVTSWSPIMLLAAVLPGSVTLATTTLDFEDIPAPATIATQYASRGVLFLDAYLDTDPAAHSGTQVLRSVPPNSEIFVAQPFVITFTSPQSRVKFFGGSQFASLNGTLQGFDADGNVVATDGPRLVPQNTFTTAFEVQTTTATVMHVEFQLEGTAFESIDDLEFEGEPPPPPPTQPPTVTITQPPDGSDLDLVLINIVGTVTGDGLLPTVTIKVEWLQPPESTAPPFTSDVSLTGSGSTRQFSLPFSGLPLGPSTITVEAENLANLKGTATSHITNLPAGIRNRFITQGGTAAVGSFRFGLSSSSCQIAVYEQAAISVDADGVTTHVVRGDILTKWLSLRSLNDPDGLGCPIGEERDAPAGRAQDFSQGTIYSGLPNGTLYVPAVFIDAINKRGGESATGVPLTDPVMPVEQLTHTWLFQQFMRPDVSDDPNDPDRQLHSSFEIRGTTPQLLLERQSGDRTVSTNATIAEVFPCSGDQGPCSVDETPPPPMPITEPGHKFCEDTTYPWGPREWQAILGDHISTPVFGVVTSSHMADVDNILTHEWTYGALCTPACPSDWLLRVRPYGPQLGVAPYPSLFAGTSRDQIKIEYERFYGEFVGWMGFPREHDLFYGAGRWIIDCGHDTYKSELHPIFMYAKMKTVRTLTDPFTGLVDENPFGGQPATQADIWVNGWYPGDPIEFDLFPPPRPTPTATLVVNKPADADAVFGINFEYSLEPSDAVSHVHVRITAPYREAHVTSAGEMIWDTNRGYEGQWFLYWSP
jgi:hypothetical protein